MNKKNISNKSCKELINGKYLAKVPKNKITSIVRSLNGDKICTALVSLISPLGIVLNTNLPKGKYEVTLANDIKVIVELVVGYCDDGNQVFDIISVFRDGNKRKKLNKEDFEILDKSILDIVDDLVEGLSKERKNIICEKLKKAVEKSQLLDAFKVGSTFKYESGRLKKITGDEDFSLTEDYLKGFIADSLANNQYKRDSVVDGGGERIYDLHALPLSYNSGGLLAIDITNLIKVERKNKEKEFEIYQDVISVVTKNKLNLINEDDLKGKIGEGDEIYRKDLIGPQDLNEVRNQVREFLLNYKFNSKEIVYVILATSEALTNALKHAGGGIVVVKILDGVLRIIVEDKGEGISLDSLSKATLMEGYTESKEFSLGKGFSIIIRFFNRLYLKTDSNGTVLLLDKKIG
ncbi:ATP-binding protein [Halonatronum saccharophilum]|uniref:ATP-binding protein n=1 Tax=Halonatronum saccharophilum TaxID=150060 RepID=UPI0004899415|nr:ATP-binding protein [Halonatronum saccharophilum]